MYRYFIIIIVLLSLVACETPALKSPETPKNDTDGLRNIIPTAELDRAPVQPKDVSTVGNAVPKIEPRTIAGNKSPYKVKGLVYRVMDDPSGYEAYGYASWYGEKFHGNRTSNGEVYDMYEMTAAHKTLPIPSYVRVTNVVTGKNIIVRVNDRGPFAHGRIIDLSYAGAKKLDFIRDGTALVKVEYIDPNAHASDQPSAILPPTQPPSPQNEKPNTSDHQVQKVSNTAQKPAPDPVNRVPVNAEKTQLNSADSSEKTPQRFLQLGAFSEESAAIAIKFQVEPHIDWPVIIEKSEGVSGGYIFRVLVGALPDEATQQTLKQSLMKMGLNEPLGVIRYI